MSEDLPWDDIDPLHQPVARPDPQLALLPAPEKACGCHPNMPNVRTPSGWACLGCGWGQGAA